MIEYNIISIIYLHVTVQEIICLHKVRDSVESNAPSCSLFFSVPLWNSGIEADYRLPQYHITFPIVHMNSSHSSYEQFP